MQISGMQLTGFDCKLLPYLASHETTTPKEHQQTYHDQNRDLHKSPVQSQAVCKKFWSEMQRKLDEQILELAARIRQATATFDFTAITDSLDEALHTRFICLINNEVVLKALFEVKDNKLTFFVQLKTRIQQRLQKRWVILLFIPGSQCNSPSWNFLFLNMLQSQMRDED